MSEKRQDNKNRILRNGESQRKNGRYMYKYIDNAGNVNHQLQRKRNMEYIIEDTKTDSGTR